MRPLNAQVDLDAFLVLAVNAHVAHGVAAGPKARAVAAARVQGIADAADRLGLINTPATLLIGLADVTRAMGTCPLNSGAPGDTTRRDWIQNAADVLRTSLIDLDATAFA